MGEVQLKEGAQAPKPVKKKHIWWRVLLAWLGGFIFFPLAVVGTAAIFGTVFTTKQIVEMSGGNADEVLGEEYQNKTILQTVQALLQTKFENLEDLNRVSPMVQKMIEENINPLLDQYIHYTVDWDEIKTKSFTGENSELSQYLSSNITENIYLADFIEDSDSLKGVFNYFLFDVQRDDEGKVIYDVDGNVTIDKTHRYSINDFMSGASFLNDVINYIKIGDVVDVTTSSPKILQTMQNWRIGNIEEKIDTMKLGSLFEDSDIQNNDLLNAIKDWTMNDLADQDKMLSLKLGDVLGDIEDGSILYSFRNDTLQQIKEKDMNSLYLTDVLGHDTYDNPSSPDYNKIIASIMENERHDRFVASGASDYEAWKAADPENAKYKSTIKTLTDEDSILGLKLQEVLGDIEEGSILYSYRNDTLEEIKAKDTSNMYLVDILDKATYENPANPKYNKVIAAIMENERYDRFVASGASDYEAWKAADPENAKFKSTVSTLTAPESIDKLKLSDVISNTSGSRVIQALFNANATVGNLSSKVDALKIEEVIEIEDGSLLDYPAIRNTEIGNSGDLIDNIKNNAHLSRVLSVNDSSPRVLKTLTDYQGIVAGKPTYGPNGCTISEIETKLQTMALKDVIDIDTTNPNTSQVLISLKDTLVFGSGTNNLTYAMNNLKFNQVFTEEQCEDSNILMSLWKNNSNGDFLINNIATAMDNVGLLDVLGNNIYENPTATSTDPDYHRLSYTWWFLLTEQTEYGTWDASVKADRKLPNTAACLNYKVNDFNRLVTNMTFHMQNEKLDALSAAGFITISPATLDKETPGGDRVGDMTMTEFIAAVDAFLVTP